MPKFLSVSLLWLLLVFMPALAGTGDAGARAQRELFRSLYIQAQSGGGARIRDSAAALKDYPLYPYLEAADLDYRLKRGQTQDDRLAALFTRHPDLGAAGSLRERWLRSLARRGEWRSFADHYLPSDDAELRCLHAQALIRLGRNTEAALAARALWLSADSQPGECDNVFAWMERSGHLSHELLATRAKLSMLANETRMVQVLARRLSGAAQRNAELWLDIRRNPLAELQKLIDKPNSGADAETIALGLRLAARQHTLRAARLYPSLQRHYLPTDAARDMALGYLCLEMALDRDPEALAWCSKLSRNPEHAGAREWRLRTAIYHSAWDKARAWIEALPEAERGEQRWRYWLARSFEGLGGAANQQQSRSLYAVLAVERGYYAYLAADRLGNGYALNHRRIPADPELRRRLETQPAALRAREFHALDLATEARREWRGFIHGQGPLELRQSAAIAEDWGWHYEAIVTLARAEYWDDLRLRYPLLYRNEVLAAARRSSVDTGWVYAIMRAESLYQPEVRSSAGAVGLMQLLPGTARAVAAQSRLSYAGTRTLLDPASNLRLGAEYLRQMRARFGGNLAMATAAYNAGPRRVEHWLPRARMPADIWVENIPYDETRIYVQRVMEHAVAFDWRLDREVTPLAKRMPSVPPSQ